MNLRKNIKLFTCIIFCITNICFSCEPTSGSDGTTQTGGSEEIESTFEGVEDDYKEPIIKLNAEKRLKELLSIYQKKNGKIRRQKVAKALNREGYRKANGKKFKMKDIPKYIY